MANISKQELHAAIQALAIIQKAQNGQGKKSKPKKRAAPNARARPKRAPVATRGLGEIVLAQGVGKVPRNPFGCRHMAGNMLCWDAFHEAHAPLPRAIGPYAVVRTTRIFNSQLRHMVFGCAVDGYDQWTSTIAWGGTGGAINAANATYTWSGKPPGVLSGDTSTLSVVPAAMSVQILNPSSIDSASGVIYAAVCPTQLNLIDNTRTWTDFETQFTSFMKPRLLSGGKLALRGVQMNSYPLNMSVLSSFEKINDYGDGYRTWKTGTGTDADAQYITGLAPMVVVNTSEKDLTYAVTTEYRVRFDISNPAVASHKLHGCTPDKTWDTMLHKAIAMGNGVKDIVETVASIGQAARAMPALMP